MNKFILILFLLFIFSYVFSPSPVPFPYKQSEFNIKCEKIRVNWTDLPKVILLAWFWHGSYVLVNSVISM